MYRFDHRHPIMKSADHQYETAAAAALCSRRSGGSSCPLFPRRSRTWIPILVLLSVSVAPYVWINSVSTWVTRSFQKRVYLNEMSIALATVCSMYETRCKQIGSNALMFLPSKHQFHFSKQSIYRTNVHVKQRYRCTFAIFILERTKKLVLLSSKTIRDTYILKICQERKL